MQSNDGPHRRDRGVISGVHAVPRFIRAVGEQFCHELSPVRVVGLRPERRVKIRAGRVAAGLGPRVANESARI